MWGGARHGVRSPPLLGVGMAAPDTIHVLWLLHQVAATATAVASNNTHLLSPSGAGSPTAQVKVRRIESRGVCVPLLCVQQPMGVAGGPASLLSEPLCLLVRTL